VTNYRTNYLGKFALSYLLVSKAVRKAGNLTIYHHFKPWTYWNAFTCTAYAILCDTDVLTCYRCSVTLSVTVFEGEIKLFNNFLPFIRLINGIWSMPEPR